MMTRVRSITYLAGFGLLLAACTDPASIGNRTPNDAQKTKTGAAIGAAVGALTGIITAKDKDDRAGRAVAGAVLGAGAGAAIGYSLDKQAEDLRRDIGNDNVQITNTGDRLIVTLPQDILFSTNSTAVRSDLRRDLRALAGNLQAYPGSTVQVIGHTDNTGNADYNQGLSVRRASSVNSVLIDSGVSSSRLQAIGRGENEPVSSNLTPEGRAQNRRVNVVIVPNQV